ncbi:hypothetical protein BDQ17DRAFT_1422147 [Cyathus striatus]|nr:hypothetical protein BDQ17DRAFT_1422147 [Cyathus striatus]
MQAKFRPRNSFYLLISKHLVLPVHVYLDEEHIEWMSDQVLQHVLSDLRPKILHKLKSETENQARPSTATGSSLSSVDSHRGASSLDTYQFCYFLRKTDPHAVVIKRRNFATNVNPSISKKKLRLNETSENSNNTALKFLDDQFPNEELEKPKPRLQLNYQGYKIFGYCLCVVVEPWTLLLRTQASERTCLSITPANSTLEDRNTTRGKTPLFLPEDPEENEDDNDNDNIFTTYPDNTQKIKSIDPNTDYGGGMLEFSQVLRNAGSMETTGLYDEDEPQSGALFGDADEERELHS